MVVVGMEDQRLTSRKVTAQVIFTKSNSYEQVLFYEVPPLGRLKHRINEKLSLLVLSSGNKVSLVSVSSCAVVTLDQ